MLMMVEGTKNGEILRGFSPTRKSLCESSMVCRPPMPDPVMTPAQRWQLKYLDAWEDSYNGRYLEAAKAYHDILDN